MCVCVPCAESESSPAANWPDGNLMRACAGAAWHSCLYESHESCSQWDHQAKWHFFFVKMQGGCLCWLYSIKRDRPLERKRLQVCDGVQFKCACIYVCVMKNVDVQHYMCGVCEVSRLCLFVCVCAHAQFMQTQLFLFVGMPTLL